MKEQQTSVTLDREFAEVIFSALMKIAVHLAKRFRFTIRPVNTGDDAVKE